MRSHKKGIGLSSGMIVAGIFVILILFFTGGEMSGYLSLNSSRTLAAVDASDIIALTNSARTQNSLGTLKENTELDAAAAAKAADMASKGYFAHVGPGGKEQWAWIQEAGYAYHYAGENLAVRFYESSDVVNAWMASPSHRANVLKPQYTEIGVGVAQGLFEGQPATYIVQYFGTPAIGRTAVLTVPPKAAVATLTQGALVGESITGGGTIDAEAAATSQ